MQTSAEPTYFNVFDHPPDLLFEALEGAEEPPRKRRCKNTSDHVPRPKNPFIIFRNDVHNQLKCIPYWTGDLKYESRYAAERWKAAAPEVKQMYKNLAQEEKAAHKRAYPDYRYEPQSRRDISNISNSSNTSNNADRRSTRQLPPLHFNENNVFIGNPSTEAALSRSATIAAARTHEYKNNTQINNSKDYPSTHSFYPPLLNFKVETPHPNSIYYNWIQDGHDRPFRSFDGHTQPNFEYGGNELLKDTSDCSVPPFGQL